MDKQYLPLMREGLKSSRASLESVSSWDEPLRFLDRKRELLLYKRSYSDSDLAKITAIEVKSQIIHLEIKLPDIRLVKQVFLSLLCPEGPGAESMQHHLTQK